MTLPVLLPGWQDVADPVERILLVASPAQRVLLDPAADLVKTGPLAHQPSGSVSGIRA